MRSEPHLKTGDRIREIHTRLVKRFGSQKNWWPAASPFEVLLGAILVQHTRWSAVEQALTRLRSGTGLEPSKLLGLPIPALEALLRSAGCYRQKARRIRAISRWYESLDWEQLAGLPTALLRTALLELEGVGPETADAILLYAFGRRVWVVDRSALRLYSRLGICRDQEADFKKRILPSLPDGIEWRKEHHALIVLHGQRYCQSEPVCKGCPLNSRCAWFHRRPGGRDVFRIGAVRNPR